MTVDVARRAGLGELVRSSAARTPDATAVVFGDRTWTYAQLLEAAEGAAGALGVAQGDRVAVLGRNSDTYLITWLATQLAGAIHVPVNFMLNAREVAYIVEHSGAALALADAELFDRLPGSTRTMTLADFEASWDRSSFIEPEIASTDVAQIAYTSGTESAPKGAMLTHEGLLAQYVSCIVAGEYSRRRDAARAAALPLRADALLHHARALPGRAEHDPARAGAGRGLRGGGKARRDLVLRPADRVDRPARRHALRRSHPDQGLLRRLDHARADGPRPERPAAGPAAVELLRPDRARAAGDLPRPGRAADQARLGGQARAQRDHARRRRGHARRAGRARWGRSCTAPSR